MFFNPDSNGFNFSVDNFGTSYLDTAVGTSCPGHGSTVSKGANTNLLNGLAEDCFALSIMFAGGSETTVIRRHASDILVDPNAGVGNAGSSWSVLIPNLYSNSPLFGAGGGGYNYYFPIYIKAGTAIGCAVQSLQLVRTLRVAVRAFGKPSRPELLKYGSKVTAYGALVSGTVGGQAVTPGTAVMGSYSTAIAVTEDAWWWQLGIGSNDTTMVDNTYLFDLAIGDATNKRIAMSAMPYLVHGINERASKAAIGNDSPVLSVAAGENIYVRGAGSVAPETTMTFVAYGLR